MLIVLITLYSSIILNTGETSSKTNTWPISDTECSKFGPNLQSYLFQAYIFLKPSRVEKNNTIHLSKLAKTIY